MDEILRRSDMEIFVESEDNMRRIQFSCKSSWR